MSPRSQPARNARAQRLAVARQAAGLSVQQAAASARVSLGKLLLIERAESEPTLDTLLALCEAYGVTPDAILLEPKP